MFSFTLMRLVGRPVSAILSLLIAITPMTNAYAQVKNGQTLSTDGVMQVDPDLQTKWQAYIKSGKIDFRAASNNSSALSLDIPASLLPSTIYRVKGAMAQIFARYDSIAAEGVIDVVWLERNLNDTITFKMDRVGGQQGNSDFGSAWGSVFASKADGYHCDNRFLVLSKDPVTKMETCQNPLTYRTFNTDENGRAILSNISFEAFIGLVGLTQAKFKVAEAWVAADNTAYGDIKRRVDQWTTSEGCGMFCKRTTSHTTMSQTGVSWYVSTPGLADRPDAIMGGFCVDPSDAADGTCNGPKVVGQTAFIKAGPDASLPQGVVMAYYNQQSKEGMTGLGFALAIFAMVALTVVTAGAASASASTFMAELVGGSGAVFSASTVAALGGIAAGGYAAISTVASDMRGVDQVQNGLFGNMSDGQLASSTGSGMGGEMNQAIRNKFIFADPLFTQARNGGMPNYVYGNAGGGNWNAPQNAYLSPFALGDNNGAPCNRAGVRSGTCTSAGRMIRPDDFFVQSFAAPDAKAFAAGTTLNRTIDPTKTTYSIDPSTNVTMQAARAAMKAKIDELLSKRYQPDTPIQ
jgi:hypothetical protein